MAKLKLTPQQLEAFWTALRDSFTPATLNQMMTTKVGRRFDDYVPLNADMRGAAIAIIQAGELEGWTTQLLLGARAFNPGSPELLALAMSLKLSSIDDSSLQRVVKAENPHLDPAIFRAGLASAEVQVCRIEITGGATTIFGTGFLVAADVIATNYHVMEPVIKKKRPPTDVRFRFDYKVVGDSVINAGQVFRLRGDDWLIDSSEPSVVDDQPEPKQAVPDSTQLDYAFVRLAGAPGSSAIVETKATRGWIALPTGAIEWDAGSPMFIMQHPDAKPLKLAIDMTGVRGLNGNGTRVTYTVNTEGGSSGAPCFDVKWGLVALHHSGDPNFDRAHKPEYNEGIPFDKILAELTRKGKRELL